MNKQIVAGLLRHFKTLCVDKSTEGQRKANNIYNEIKYFLSPTESTELQRQWNFYLQNPDPKDMGDLMYTIEVLIQNCNE